MTIYLWVVRDLTHPINVGQNFLRRIEGRIEYTVSEGYLDLKGNKTKLIRKTAAINDSTVIDSSFQKVF